MVRSKSGSFCSLSGSPGSAAASRACAVARNCCAASGSSRSIRPRVTACTTLWTCITFRTPWILAREKRASSRAARLSQVCGGVLGRDRQVAKSSGEPLGHRLPPGIFLLGRGRGVAGRVGLVAELRYPGPQELDRLAEVELGDLDAVGMQLLAPFRDT